MTAVAGCVAVAVGGLVTAGSLDGTVMDDVPVAVAVAVDGTVDGADVAVDDEGVEVTVELLGDDELADNDEPAKEAPPARDAAE